MVAKVICGKNIKGAVAYNEHKVAEGVAECIASSRFGLDAQHLSLHQKVVRFEKLLQLNKRVKTNALHISLNFHQSEKLTKDQLINIANDYVEKIGFGSQPYLVYDHRDAAHPHIHIVTTNITSEGKRIDLHNIGRERSENARKAIEEEYGLVRAEGRRASETLAIPKPAYPIAYGRAETKKAITDVVKFVTSQYKYSSLPELNAVLSHYNVTAFRGYEGSTMHRNEGLVYSIIDSKGNRVGVPIKASSINGKPTLKALQAQFTLGPILKKPMEAETRKLIESVLAARICVRLDTFQKQLSKKNIDLVIRTNTNGQVYGLTYVDHTSKVAFKGSDLGKHLGANGIMERFSPVPSLREPDNNKEKAISNRSDDKFESIPQLKGTFDLIDKVIRPEQGIDGISAASQNKKRRKRRRKSI